MRLRGLWLAAAALVSSCGSGADSVVVVDVTADPSGLPVPPMVQVRAIVSNGGTSDTKLFPENDAALAPIALPASFAVVVPRTRAGSLDVALDGLDAAGLTVASGAGSTRISRGAQARVAIQLRPGPSLCGNRQIDLGEQCDDGNRYSGDGCNFQCVREEARDAGSATADLPQRGDGTSGTAPADSSGMPSPPTSGDASVPVRPMDAAVDAPGATGPKQPSGAPCSVAAECASGLCLGSPLRCAPDTPCDADSGLCRSCGTAGRECCPGSMCSDGSCCVNVGQSRICTAVGAACGATGTTCQSSGSCGACGGFQETCCAGNVCTRSGFGCVGGRCVPCGAVGQPCCSPSGTWACQVELRCDPAALTCVAPPRPPPPPNTAGLVGQWKFDENMGTVAADASGNGNVGTIGTVGTPPVWVDGRFGSALRFEGSGASVTVDDSTSLQLRGTALTMQAWVRTTMTNTFPVPARILTKQQGSGGYRLFFSPATAIPPLCAAAPRVYCVPADFPIGVWKHVAAVISAGTMSLYVDGALLGSEGGHPTTLVPSTAPLVLGMYPFVGDLDDVRIYSVARSPAEICVDAARTWSGGACQ